MTKEGITVSQTESKLRDALSWVLPMAKGYAHEHPVGGNQDKVDSAQQILEEFDAQASETNAATQADDSNGVTERDRAHGLVTSRAIDQSVESTPLPAVAAPSSSAGETPSYMTIDQAPITKSLVESYENDTTDSAFDVLIPGVMQLERELAAAKAQNLRIVRGTFGQICSYCGWESGQEGGQWDDLQSHIRACEQHPLRKAEAARDELQAELTATKSALENLSSCEICDRDLATKRGDGSGHNCVCLACLNTQTSRAIKAEAAVAELEAANVGLATESAKLFGLIDALVIAADGMESIDSMDEEYAPALARLDAAVEAARPFTEKAMIEESPEAFRERIAKGKDDETDARRYRWLRENDDWDAIIRLDYDDYEHLMLDELDQAIDAAVEGKHD